MDRGSDGIGGGMVWKEALNGCIDVIEEWM